MHNFINFNSFDDFKNLTKEEIIELKKSFSRIRKDILAKNKKDSCLICGKPCASFCNSHTLPHFILEFVADNGYVFNTNTEIGLILKEDKDGINKAGTFHIICRDCDSSFFQKYENPESYTTAPSNDMLQQIGLKTMLREIYKKHFELGLNKYTLDNSQEPYKKHAVSIINSTNLDLIEYNEEFKKVLNDANSGKSDSYNLIFYEELPYRVPMGFQGRIALISDLNDNIINDIYNFNPQYKIEHLHLCIFPLKAQSVIFLFTESTNERYDLFSQQIESLSFLNRLKLINYIIFAYSEEVFFHSIVMEKMNNDTILSNLVRQSSLVLSNTPTGDFIKSAADQFSLRQRNSITNFLTPKYQIYCGGDKNTQTKTNNHRKQY